MTHHTSLSTYIAHGIFVLIASVALYAPTTYAVRVSDLDPTVQQVTPLSTNSSTVINGNTTAVSAGSHCSLNSFSPANISITKWGSTNVSWSETGCASLTLASSDGAFTNTSVLGKSSVSTGELSANTSYVLTGTGDDGTVVQRTVLVTVPDAKTTSACQIYFFSANGSSYMQLYAGQSATLAWNTSDGCSNISVSGTNGAYFGNLGNQSSLSVGPFTDTTTYTLSALDSSGNPQTQQVVVTVNLGTQAGGGGSGGSGAYYDNTADYNTFNNAANSGYNSTSYNTNTNSSNYYGGGTNATTYYGSNNGSNCTINSFQPSSYYITSGQSVTFTWSTVGCYSLFITAPSGAFPTYYYLPPSGSMTTNALYGTSNFTLTANGNNSTAWPPVTVYVTGGPYPYTLNQSVGTNAVTGVATNIGAYSARLNGVAIGGNAPTTAWFEYGTTTELDARTGDQTFAPGQTMIFYDTMYSTPGTTYYYRAVTQSNGVISRGSLMTLVTKESSDDVLYVQSKSVSNTTATTTTDGPTVTVTDGSDKIYIGDTVDIKIDYANGTNKKLTNVKLNVVLPQGFSIVQSTKGQMVSPTMVMLDVNTLAPGQTDSLFVQAKVTNTVSLSSTLVTNVTMSYTFPNGVSDSAVGYVLNHAVGVSALGGFALGAGFFPTTILGWIVTILIILAVILTIRRLTKAKSGGHGAVHH